jgi:hypothetical protein
MSAQEGERASRSSSRPELVPLRLIGERAAAAAAAATAAVAIPCVMMLLSQCAVLLVSTSTYHRESLNNRLFEKTAR